MNREAKEEESEQRTHRGKRKDVRARHRPEPEYPQPNEWRRGPALDGDERCNQHRRERQNDDGLYRAPTNVGRLDNRIDKQREPRCDGDRPAEIETAIRFARTTFRNERYGSSDDKSRDRNVDVEDPFPADRVRQHAAQQHTGRAAQASNCTPDAERPVALRALVKHGEDDRERGRRQKRGTESLSSARCYQPRVRLGKAAEQRRHSEDDQPGDEDPAPSKEIGHPPTEKKKAPESQQIGVEDPREIVLREPKIDTDRRQRDGDDRRIQYNDELRCRKQSKHEPLARTTAG